MDGGGRKSRKSKLGKLLKFIVKFNIELPGRQDKEKNSKKVFKGDEFSLLLTLRKDDHFHNPRCLH